MGFLEVRGRHRYVSMSLDLTDLEKYLMQDSPSKLVAFYERCIIILLVIHAYTIISSLVNGVFGISTVALTPNDSIKSVQ